MFLTSEEFPRPNSKWMIPMDEPCAEEANPHENRPITEADRGYLVQFSPMAENKRMIFNPYRSMSEIARGRIAQPYSKLELSFEATGILYHQQLFDSAPDTQFVLDKGAKHQPIPCGVSPIDVKDNQCSQIGHCASFHPGCPERMPGAFLSMQKNISGRHGTRLGMEMMGGRLRSTNPLHTRRSGQEEVALAGAEWSARIEEDVADELAEVMNTNNDSETDDDCDAE
jgi:hypothetical protein